MSEKLKSEDNVDLETNNLSNDLFYSTISDPSQDLQKNNTEDMDELFRQNSKNLVKEIKLTDDEEDDPFSTDSKKDEPEIKNNQINQNLISSSNKQVLKNNAYTISNTFDIEEEEEEDRDKFIDIAISNPTKVGDGMGSYMVFRITTKTNYPVFKNSEFSTNRRFSDFLNLFEKLREKHINAGRILPPAPEKDMIGMAKVKMSKEDTTPIDFIEKRRAALERFLNRLAKHKILRYDPDFRDFLEIADGLPKATNTSALSGAGMIKMFTKGIESVSKIAIKMDETDQWFEEKTRNIDNLYLQFKKLHSTIEMLYGWRRDLATSSKEFSKSAAILANSEEQLNLSRSLSQLGEIYEKIEQIYVEQGNADYFIFSELTKDYVCLFDNIKEILYQRIKLYNNWQKAEETLRSKKETKVKLEASNKQDKIPTVAAEIIDWESKVEKSKEEFEQISKSIKEEVKRFDISRAKEFKTELTKYLNVLLNNQEQLVNIWEQYLPQVKAI